MSEEVHKEYLLENYVEEIFNFHKDPSTYEERVGKPDELSSVIGRVSMSFQRLEDVLSAHIIEMLEIDEKKGKIIIAELSFTNKVNLFSSLFHLLKNEKVFNYGKFDKDDFFRELKRAILRCQELRNQVIHSSFLKNYKTDFKIIKHKLSAKSKHGLKEVIEETDIPYLFDISDYTICISSEVEQFFIGFSPIKESDKHKVNKSQLSDIFKYRV